MKLLTMETILFLAYEGIRDIICPQCDSGGLWLYSTWQTCFCFNCDYHWDRIDIHAPILMDGSGVAA